VNRIERDIDLDKKVATQIMGWDNNRANLEEFEEDENSNSFPEYSSDMNYAIFVAEKVKLFNNFVLHKKKDVTSQDWVWQI
jgi:hypothetical protein